MLLATLVAGLLACMACGWLGLQVAGPLQVAARLHAENDRLERQVRAKEIQNQIALRRVQSIATDQGAILAARARGYMFANERPLHIQSDGTP